VVGAVVAVGVPECTALGVMVSASHGRAWGLRWRFCQRFWRGMRWTSMN
jgi:hypothetical protein